MAKVSCIRSCCKRIRMNSRHRQTAEKELKYEEAALRYVLGRRRHTPIFIKPRLANFSAPAVEGCTRAS